MDEEFLSRTALAAKLGVNRETISRWTRSGCPVSRATIRARMWFSLAAVEAWLIATGRRK